MNLRPKSVKFKFISWNRLSIAWLTLWMKLFTGILSFFLRLPFCFLFAKSCRYIVSDKELAIAAKPVSILWK